MPTSLGISFQNKLCGTDGYAVLNIMGFFSRDMRCISRSMGTLRVHKLSACFGSLYNTHLKMIEKVGKKRRFFKVLFKPVLRLKIKAF